MKMQITQKQIKQGYYNIIKVGYCDIQYLLYGLEANYYNAGVYGWNCDIYIMNPSTVIVTGYRPFGNIDVDYNFNKKLENKARAIACDYSIDYKKRIAKIEKLRNKFVEHYTNK